MSILARTTSWAIALVAAAAVAVAGCGGGNAGTADAAPFNDADVTFAQGMIPHHEQAVEMADIALDPQSGASAAIRDLATRIKNAQDPEIAQMTTWLTEWDKPLTMDHSNHDMSMHGMMSSDDMAALDDVTGSAFDAMFARMMIAHHEGAVTMSKTVQVDGENSDVRALAGRIIESQTAEIEEMRTLAD